MTKTALNIANAFIKLSEPESGDSLTNLKLQKLLYYVQGFHWALYDKPLFSEKLVAWQHGPVVSEVYFKFNKYGANTIDQTIDDEYVEFTTEESDLISEVNAVYGQFSGWKLRDMTHNESPWLETPSNQEITKEKLISFFTPLVNKN